jgi:hypothetical protein
MLFITHMQTQSATPKSQTQNANPQTHLSRVKMSMVQIYFCAS